MEERYHATTQNRFYPDMSNVNKNITVEAKLISPPTYVGGRDISVGIAIRYGLDSPGIESQLGKRISAPVQTGPFAHPASYMGTGSFLGVKRPDSGFDHPPSSSAEVKEGIKLHFYSTSGPSWLVMGSNLPLPLLV